jgi:hypothetical protein
MIIVVAIVALINIAIAVYMDIWFKSKFISMQKRWENTVNEYITFLMEVDLAVIKQNFEIDRILKIKRRTK